LDFSFGVTSVFALCFSSTVWRQHRLCYQCHATISTWSHTLNHLVVMFYLEHDVCVETNLPQNRFKCAVDPFKSAPWTYPHRYPCLAFQSFVAETSWPCLPVDTTFSILSTLVSFHSQFWKVDFLLYLRTSIVWWTNLKKTDCSCASWRHHSSHLLTIGCKAVVFLLWPCFKNCWWACGARCTPQHRCAPQRVWFLQELPMRALRRTGLNHYAVVRCAVIFFPRWTQLYSCLSLSGCSAVAHANNMITTHDNNSR